MAGCVTFAVVGHDEADTLANPLAMVFEARAPGDTVLFVDSASTDGSAEVARSLGADVLSAPLGKGRAIWEAYRDCGDEHICFIDADLEHASTNIALELRDAALRTGADMVVGEFVEPARRRVITPAIYRPLLGALFPELASGRPAMALSGFRILRTGLELDGLPPGYGVEVHLDLVFQLRGAKVCDHPIGTFRGKLRGYTNVPAIALDVATAMLDVAQQDGRLTPDSRRDWDAWVDAVVDVLRTQPPPGDPDADFLELLTATAARPFPPIGLDAT